MSHQHMLGIVIDFTHGDCGLIILDAKLGATFGGLRTLWAIRNIEHIGHPAHEAHRFPTRLQITDATLGVIDSWTPWRCWRGLQRFLDFGIRETIPN